MLQPLVVGLGRSGPGLHVRALARLADRAVPTGGPLLVRPAVGCDPRAAGPCPPAAPGTTVVSTLDEALEYVDPATSVAHLCMSPRLRYALAEELAGHGFRRMIVEKPLAGTLDELDALVRLRDEAGLRLMTVAHWNASRLAGRLRRLVRGGRLGALRRITVDQHKPRFLRSLTPDGHQSALDVEIPHSLALALDLAGPAELRAAHCWDLRCEDRELPRMGGAHVELEHRSGVVTLLRSDLGAPVRQRSVVCEFDGGTATGHFPLGEDDDHAQLVVEPGELAGPVNHPGSRGPRPGRHVFRDDALTDYMEAAYRRFLSEPLLLPAPVRPGPVDTADTADFTLACASARLLCAAREAAAAPTSAEDH